jgi:hypothetical protein
MILAIPAISTAAAMKIAISSVLLSPPELVEPVVGCTVTGPDGVVVVAGVVVVGVNSDADTPLAPVAPVAPATAGSASVSNNAAARNRRRRAT